MCCAWLLSHVKTLCDPMHCSPPGSSVHGLPCPPWGDLPSPGIEPRFPTLQAESLPFEPPGKPKNTGVDSLSPLQGNFPTQELNWGLLHSRRILYQLSYTGSPSSSVIHVGGGVTHPLKYKSESEVVQSCPTLCNPMDCSLPGSSVHRVFQARVLEWVAIAFSRRSSSQGLNSGLNIREHFQIVVNRSLYFWIGFMGHIDYF